jgi:hypothetical protein
VAQVTEEPPVVVQIATGERVVFHYGNEYELTTRIQGLERYDRRWRLGFVGRRYPPPSHDLHFTGRGPDRTHKRQYAGDVTIDARSIVTVTPVERDVAKRFADGRRAYPVGDPRDKR